ncbi:MAG: hypothetical protein Kapaf2KO_09320 [Candidatus Kapaibacteriales bacterium]
MTIFSQNLILICFLILLTEGLKAEIFWADTVLDYSSRYSPTLYSEKEIVGKPNSMPQGGNLATSWSPSLANDGLQHITIGFDTIRSTKTVFIAENYNPGSVVSIELYDESGNLLNNYRQIAEPTRFSKRMWKVGLKQNYLVKSIRIVLDTEKISGYNLIDAIGVSQFDENFVSPLRFSEELFKYDSENIGPNINTVNSDRFPVISADNQTLYFCRTGDTNNYGSYYLTDIYYSVRDSSGEFTKAENMGRPLNNEYSNFVTTAMPDGNTLVLGTSYYKDNVSSKGVAITKRNGKNWSYPSNIYIKDIGFTGEFNEYFLTADGLHLILGIERQDSRGKNDLYVSERINDTLFSEPVSLGNSINTAEHEAYPFLASDGRTLYFASSGYPGYGETDIYVARRTGDSWTEWSEPLNLGHRINTSKFEGNISLPASGDYAYFVSSIYGYGQEDIFRIKLPEMLMPEPVVLISGKVYDEDTKKPVGTSIIYEDIITGNLLGKAFSDPSSGNYSISLPSGRMYSYSAEENGFYGIRENIDLRQNTTFDTLYRDLVLAPFRKDYSIRLNNIFFDSGESILLEESRNELDRLAEYIILNEVKIRIEGHTDDVGSSASNIKLSKDRAEAVQDYLIKKGVKPQRLSSKGFGESKPISKGKTAADRKINRRVEFRIVN